MNSNNADFTKAPASRAQTQRKAATNKRKKAKKNNAGGMAPYKYPHMPFVSNMMPPHHHPYSSTNLGIYKGGMPLTLPPNSYPPPHYNTGKYPPPPPHQHLAHHPGHNPHQPPHTHFMGGSQHYGNTSYGYGMYGQPPPPTMSVQVASIPPPPQGLMPLSNINSNLIKKLPVYPEHINNDRSNSTSTAVKSRKKSISSVSSEPLSDEKSRFPMWSSAEDDALKDEIEKQRNNPTMNWTTVASNIPGTNNRTADDCIERWNRITAEAAAVKGPWTEDEDNTVVELVAKLGAKHWSKIASHLPGRIGKQCRERWHNHLNPDICKEAWTLQEDTTILKCHVSVGNRWAEMAKLLPGRYESMLTNSSPNNT